MLRQRNERSSSVDEKHLAAIASIPNHLQPTNMRHDTGLRLLCPTLSQSAQHSKLAFVLTDTDYTVRAAYVSLCTARLVAPPCKLFYRHGIARCARSCHVLCTAGRHRQLRGTQVAREVIFATTDACLSHALIISALFSGDYRDYARLRRR